MSFFGDNVTPPRDTGLNNVVIRKASWSILLILLGALVGAVISIYFK